MEKQRLAKAKNTLLNSAFSFGMRQDFVNFVNFLKKHNISIEDHNLLVNQEKEVFKESQRQDRLFKRIKKLLQKTIKCPECRSQMTPQLVNTGPGDQTGDSSKAVYTCVNKECMHQIFE